MAAAVAAIEATYGRPNRAGVCVADGFGVKVTVERGALQVHDRKPQSEERVAGTLSHLLTIEQLAEHPGVTQRHIRRLVAEKRVPYLKWCRFIRFDPTEITAWLDNARKPETSWRSGRGA